MFRKRSARGGSRGGSNLNRLSSQAQKPRGTFENNAWLCDCDPKLPAEHFRVKKEGPNKGRWFYTCQKQQDERCGFFLWDEDAEPRMQAAVLNSVNSVKTGRSPEAPPPHTRPLIGRPHSEAQHGLRSQKRTRDEVEADDSETESEAEEQYPWPPTAEDCQVAEAAAKASNEQVRGRISPPSTPRKAQKTEEFATPASHIRSGLATELGLITPTTNTNADRTGLHPPSAVGQESPTPSRFRDALAKPAQDITATVFSYLGATQTELKSDTAAGLRSILDMHSQQVRGLTKGRDVAREAIKTRDLRVSELVKRVEGLEADLEMYRAMVKSLREEKGRGGG